MDNEFIKDLDISFQRGINVGILKAKAELHLWILRQLTKAPNKEKMSMLRELQKELSK